MRTAYKVRFNTQPTLTKKSTYTCTVWGSDRQEALKTAYKLAEVQGWKRIVLSVDNVRLAK